jgi:hypothetical protein
MLGLLIASAVQAELYSWRDEYGTNHLTQDAPPVSCKSKDCMRYHQQRQDQLDNEARKRNEEAARKREQELAAMEKQQKEIAQQRATQQVMEARRPLPAQQGNWSTSVQVNNSVSIPSAQSYKSEEQKRTEDMIRIRSAIDGRRISQRDAETLRKAGESIVENDRRNAARRERLGLD